MKANALSSLLYGALLFAVGCQSAESQKLESGPTREASGAASATSTVPTINRGKLILGDDFSNPASGWERNRDEDYVADYLEGEYQIKNAVDHQITRGMFESREASDGDFSVTARKMSGPDDVRLGLVARYTGQDFLEASVLPDGRCNLWMARYEGYVLKTKPNFQPCSAVHRGNETNQLRLIVSGAKATFFVNGEKVAELDNIGREGRGFGLFANSTSAGSDIRFDNFRLHEAR